MNLKTGSIVSALAANIISGVLMVTGPANTGRITASVTAQVCA